MPKLLIADDNKQISAVLSEYAKKSGYEVMLANNGQEALEVFATFQPDLILLDVMMPILDGFSVCQQIRLKSNVPIIMITARGEDYEKIMGLEIGADDYIVKPFSPNVVMAHAKALMRRITQEDNKESKIVTVDNLEIDLDTYTVSINHNRIDLTKKELEILWFLASKPNKAFSRNELLNTVWGYEYFGDNRTVDSHIKRLRAKLSIQAHPNWDISTIWGVGYKLEIEETMET